MQSIATVGIMPTQLNGRTCDMDKISSIADKHSLFVVEDSAQALGSRYKGKNAGTFGLACISFPQSSWCLGMLVQLLLIVMKYIKKFINYMIMAEIQKARLNLGKKFQVR